MSRLETADQARETVTLWDFTGLGRPVDPRVPSNRLAIIGTTLAGLVATTAGVVMGSVDLAAGASTAAGVFIAWAIGRELDPDNPRSAALGMLLALVLGLTVGIAALGAAVTLLGLRVLVGSVGRQLKSADYILLVGAMAFAGTQPYMWPSALLLVAALVVTRPRHTALLVPALVAAFLVSAVLLGSPIDPNGSPSGLMVATLGVLASLASLPGGRVMSRTDSGTSLISSERVALARLLAGLAIAASALLAENAIPALVPAFSALASVAVVTAFTGGASSSNAAAQVANG